MADGDAHETDSHNGAESIFGKWLIEHRLSAYAQRAGILGFDDWPDLGLEAADAQASAEAIIQKRAEHPGDYNRIVNGWRQWEADRAAEEQKDKDKKDKDAKKAEEKDAKSLLDLPTLPEKAQLDLSAPTVTIDDVTYTIPTSLGSTDTSEVWHADELTGPAWLVLARRTRLLYGVRVDAVFDARSAEAPESALVWEVPGNNDYVKVNDDSQIRSDLSYTSNANSRAKNQMIETHGSLKFPYVSASVKAARDEKAAGADVSKRLRMTGQWYFPRATVNLDLCTALSPRFVDAITRALAVPDERQRAELSTVFERFGTAYPRRVDLGGSLYFVSERDTTGAINTSEVTRTLQGAISVKAGLVGGEAGASFQDGTSTSVSAQEIAETTQFTAIGGDTTLGGNPAQWQGTVKNANNWRIIGRHELASLVERLPDEAPDRLRSRVSAVWERGTMIRWDGLTPPKDYVEPEIPGLAFTMTDVQGRPLGHTAPSDLSPYGRLRRGEKADLGNPVDNHLVWRLFYTGETTEPDGHGDAKYWIAAHDARLRPPQTQDTTAGLDTITAWRQAIFPQPFVYVLMAPDGEGTLRLAQAASFAYSGSRPDPATTFTLTPADPGGARGDRFRSAYLIRRAGTESTMLIRNTGAKGSERYLSQLQGDRDYAKFCCWCRPVEA